MKKPLADLSLKTVLLVARDAGQKAASNAVRGGRVVAGSKDGKLVEYGPGSLPLPQTPSDTHAADRNVIPELGFGREAAQALDVEAQRRIAEATARMQSAPLAFTQEERDALASYEGRRFRKP
jgi:hypothetical protein